MKKNVHKHEHLHHSSIPRIDTNDSKKHHPKYMTSFYFIVSVLNQNIMIELLVYN